MHSILKLPVLVRLHCRQLNHCQMLHFDKSTNYKQLRLIENGNSVFCNFEIKNANSSINCRVEIIFLGK